MFEILLQLPFWLLLVLQPKRCMLYIVFVKSSWHFRIKNLILTPFPLPKKLLVWYPWNGVNKHLVGCLFGIGAHQNSCSSIVCRSLILVLNWSSGPLLELKRLGSNWKGQNALEISFFLLHSYKEVTLRRLGGLWQPLVLSWTIVKELWLVSLCFV